MLSISALVVGSACSCASTGSHRIEQGGAAPAAGDHGDPAGTVNPATPSGVRPGPDADAVCAALATPSDDPWARFERVVPVLPGGLLAVFDGNTPSVAEWARGLGLLDVVTIPCAGARSLVWIPGAGASAVDPLRTVGERDGAHLSQTFTFDASEGRERARALVSDPSACAAAAELFCRYRVETVSDLTECTAITLGPPPRGMGCRAVAPDD